VKASSNAHFRWFDTDVVLYLSRSRRKNKSFDLQIEIGDKDEDDEFVCCRNRVVVYRKLEATTLRDAQIEADGILHDLSCELWLKKERVKWT
jgi:hypothetical protein